MFLLNYSYLRSHAAALHPLDAFAQWCACTSRDTLTLVTANVIAWVVAVSGSYAMNSFITFAAESGRRLRWLDYGTFVASGILGVIANTTALVVAAHFVPVLPAKGCAILTAFAVNFLCRTSWCSARVVMRPPGPGKYLVPTSMVVPARGLLLPRLMFIDETSTNTA
jgi:putative flippase GtrA